MLDQTYAEKDLEPEDILGIVHLADLSIFGSKSKNLIRKTSLSVI